MLKSKNWNQAVCENCGSWHFSMQLDDNFNPVEYKCCRCGRLEKPRHLVPVVIKNDMKVGTIGDMVKK